MKLLLVEDNLKLQKVICKGLERCKYSVDTAENGEDALECYLINEYDLVILDLNLPLIDGIDVLKKIRKKDREIKIIVLSARVSVEDKVLGINLGANDYLTKPFDFFELEARIRSLLGRQFYQTDTKLICQNLVLDMQKKEVRIDNSEVHLTRIEYGILEYIMFRHPKVISAEEIIEHVWYGEVNSFSNSFKIHLHALRKKLSLADRENKKFVSTIRGIGYKMIESEVNTGV